MEPVFDVIIVGGGVVGCAVAWYLSHFDLRVVLLEKERDVCCGVSKANTGVIHSRSYFTPHTLKGELHLRSLELFPSLERELDFHCHKVGALTIAFSLHDLQYLNTLKERGKNPHAEIIGPQELKELEPLVNPEVIACYYDPETKVVSPFLLTLALAEFAVLNGVEFIFFTEVLGFEETRDALSVQTNRGVYRARVAINCTGIHATSLAQKTGETIPLHRLYRGQYFVLDRDCQSLVKHVLYPVPTVGSKGILVTPTPEGNILVGPNFELIPEEDTATTKIGLEEVERGGGRLVPSLPLHKTITTFSGIRPTLPDRDFRIFFSLRFPRLLHLCGIESPGLTASLGIAEYVGEQIQKTGILFREKKVAPRVSFPVFRTASWEEREKLIAQDPDWGDIVCRCEEVTLAEIKHALSSCLPASTLDGLKRRVRVMAGRCQGSFCGMHLPDILMGKSLQKREAIMKSGEKSWYCLDTIGRAETENASTR